MSNLKKLQSKQLDEFFEAILMLKTKDDCYAFFEDVCTLRELNSISQKTGAKLPYDNTKPVSIYGFLVGGEVEVKLYRNFSFLFGIEEYWYKSSKYADWNFGLSSGLKCYL